MTKKEQVISKQVDKFIDNIKEMFPNGADKVFFTSFTMRFLTCLIEALDATYESALREKEEEIKNLSQLN